VAPVFPDDEPTRAQRVPTSIVATVTAGKRCEPFSIENISVSGAKLEGPLSLKKGEHITILFEAEGHSVRLAAEVMRVETPDLMTDQIAARFIDPSPADREVIQHLVNKLLDEQADNDDELEIEE
jgi:hypothetical protein